MRPVFFIVQVESKARPQREDPVRNAGTDTEGHINLIEDSISIAKVETHTLPLDAY